MSRLQKRCVVASSTFHGLLLLVLFFGSALMPKPDEKPFNPIMVYSAAQVSDAMTRGGEPVAAPQAPTPLPPATPTPQAKPVVQPPPPKPEPPVKHIDPPKPVVEKTHVVERPKPEIKEIPIPTPPKPQHKIVIDDTSLKPTTRKADEKAKAAQDAADAEARAQSKRRAQEFASSLKSISRNLSSKTPLVELKDNPGFGGGGEVSVNYRDLIASMYYNAWVAPIGLTDETPIVVASITVARSGEVTSARVTKSSGNSLMDRSIEHVLETVKFIEPFPASSHDNERTFTINFNVQAKRQIG